jgi:trehalose 6-phosphate synthase
VWRGDWPVAGWEGGTGASHRVREPAPGIAGSSGLEALGGRLGQCAAPSARVAGERLGGLGGWRGRPAGPRRGLEVELLSVALGRREVEDYYHGFANRTLWPLLHGLIEQPVFERSWWRAYRDVNERFAAVDVDGGGLRWVHDYQLMLVSSLLRRGALARSGSPCTYPSRPRKSTPGLPWQELISSSVLPNKPARTSSTSGK